MSFKPSSPSLNKNRLETTESSSVQERKKKAATDDRGHTESKLDVGNLDAECFSIDEAMRIDQHRLRRQRKRLGNDEFLRRLAESVMRRRRREQYRSRLEFPDELPISQYREQIVELIQKRQVIVVCGETGSGKSTQLPKFCLEAGLGRAAMIGHTQPRRLAARSIATRLAEELDCKLGDQVGYQVRFGDQTGPDTLIKLMTDGILLAETGTDRFLDQYDAIIIDEAHERSLNIDFYSPTSVGCNQNAVT